MRIALLIALLSLAFAGGTEDVSGRLTGALCILYDTLTSLMGPLLVLVVVVAAVAYAGGNVLGAEVGAKAKSWATNMIIYATIAVIIFFGVPYLLSLIAPELNLQEACQ